MTDVDIISLDQKIHQHLQSQSQLVGAYTSKMNDIERIMSHKNLDKDVRQKLAKSLAEYQAIITQIEDDQTLNFYITESLPIIEEYKKALRTPLKLSFVGSCKSNEPEKQRLISEFLNVARKYVASIGEFLSISSSGHSEIKSSFCDKCKGKSMIMSEGNIFVCLDCGYEKEVYTNTLSYKDTTRTNILQKYSYERRSHFRDCINQFQGKQNCKIDPDIYKDLNEQFEKHRLLQGDDDTPKEIRYQKIKKEHVMLFLKELHYDKQYENVNYIYCYLTGTSCPDISYLEDQLMADFDILVNLYIKKFKYEKKIDRKSFMNIQYVFFQLLNKNKYPCRKEDFNILKTTDRKAFHDDVFKELFEELGWNHTPFF